MFVFLLNIYVVQNIRNTNKRNKKRTIGYAQKIQKDRKTLKFY